MMIVHPIPITSKQQNQPNRECLYAWYPEVINNTSNTILMEPRDIYIHNGIDKDLLQQKPQPNECKANKDVEITSAYNNSNTNVELLQHYKQSIAPNDRTYHTAETIDEALTTPWALHYEIKRRPATPNFPLNSTNMPINEEPPRRLKSAPIVRWLPPPTAILTIPEPRFINAIIPIQTTKPIPPPPTASRPQTRASSAKAQLNTTVPSEANQQHREIRSAQGARRKVETKLSDEEIQKIFKQVYGDQIEQPQKQQQQPIQIIYTNAEPSNPPPPAPVYVYQKSASWCADRVPSAPVRNTIEVSAIQLNPHYIHRPGVIAVRNIEKKSVVRETSASRKASKHYRRYSHNYGKRNEPLLALTPIPQKSKLSLEIDGVKLTYDPKITLDDKSSNITKYFVDGRLYLIKHQRYNVLDNIDPTVLEKYNQNLNVSQRPKYYQKVPMENFQMPEFHYNPSETHFSNTSPKRVHRYVIDPNLISENLNVNRMSLSERPTTATVYT